MTLLQRLSEIERAVSRLEQAEIKRWFETASAADTRAVVERMLPKLARLGLVPPCDGSVFDLPAAERRAYADEIERRLQNGKTARRILAEHDQITQLWRDVQQMIAADESSEMKSSNEK